MYIFCIYMCVCMYTCIYTYIHTYIYLFIYWYMYVCMYLCVCEARWHVHIHVCIEYYMISTHTHAHMYIRMHTNKIQMYSWHPYAHTCAGSHELTHPQSAHRLGAVCGDIQQQPTHCILQPWRNHHHQRRTHTSSHTHNQGP